MVGRNLPGSAAPVPEVPDSIPSADVAVLVPKVPDSIPSADVAVLVPSGPWPGFSGADPVGTDGDPCRSFPEVGSSGAKP